MQKVKQDLVSKRDQQEAYKRNEMKVRQHYKVLADLFRYPGADYVANVNACSEELKESYPEAHDLLARFVSWVNTHDIHEVEELFGKTFHIQAICYLDLGYVLFAEDYKRGDFLVQMKREMANANLDPGEELADNLPNVLKWMSVMQDEEFLEEFSIRIMKPVLAKMIKEFDKSRIELKDKVRKKKQKVIIMPDLQNRNIYQSALEAIENVVTKDYSAVYDDPVIQPNLGIDALSCGSGCATPAPAVSKEPVKVK